ncbi:MAG: hypothetical protein IKP07_06250 [Bacilli bacterium]|nr:hypothetical protein [Bacilli bacterium]
MIKDILKNGLKSFLFGVIFLLLALGISYILTPKYNLDKYDIFTVSGNKLLWEEKDTIDIIFLGDSLTYSGISPIDLWHEFGYTSFDYGYPAQKITTSYEDLKIAIDTQHPKVVMMEANVLMRDPAKSPRRYAAMKQQDSYLPIITFHNNWKKVLFTNVKDSLGYNWIDPYKGLLYIYKTKPGDVGDYMVNDVDGPAKIPEGNYEVLLKIKKLCDDNNITFILMSAPNGKSWHYGRYLAAKETAEKLGVPYLEMNLNDPIHIDWNTDTKDYGEHLNYRGAKKTTTYIGNYLKEQNLVKDHRNDPEYENWRIAWRLFDEEIRDYK